jgi:hypothetical protein
MPLTASEKTGGKDFELIEAQPHHAVCVWVVDLGTQPSNNPKFPDYHKCNITWELPEVRIQFEKDGVEIDKPRVITRELTISLSEKSTMRPLLESWRGRGFNAQELIAFDLKNLVGVNCLLNVIHREVGNKTYANADMVMPLPKSMGKLEPENETIFYSIEDDGFTIPDAVPSWMVDKIHKCTEYQEMANPGFEEEKVGGYGEMNDFPGDRNDIPPAPPEELDSIPF